MTERVEVSIENMAFGGHGVARHAGVVIFVFGAMPGERVLVQIDQKKKRFWKGTCVEVLEASPQRIVPPCPWFGECGGCAYQYASYSEQLIWKRAQVRDLVQRIGKIVDPVVEPTLPSPREYRYRNRLTLHWDDGAFGFFDRKSGHRIVEVKDCLLATEGIAGKITHFGNQNRESGHVTLRSHPDRRFFEQTNPAAASLLLKAVESCLPPTQKSLLIDAYCGSGFFSLAFADRFEKVVGIERDTFATDAATAKGGANTRFLNGDVADLLSAILAEESSEKTTVVMDPPSEGLTPKVVETLLGKRPAILIYVSCNPSTFARDLAQLSGVYQLKLVQPVDMFPQTAEIELVGCMELVK